MLIGFRADMEHELEGVGGWSGGVFPGSPLEPDPSLSSADPAFFARAFFLNYFIEVNVPSLSERIYGMDLLSDTGGPGDATEAELEQSVQIEGPFVLEFVEHDGRLVLDTDGRALAERYGWLLDLDE